MDGKPRRSDAWVLLLLLVMLGGMATMHFADRSRAPRTGGPNLIERNPLAVLAGEVETAADAAGALPDSAEVIHPAEVIVRVLAPDDEPVAGARVAVRDALTTWNAVADARGEVALAGLEAGECLVLARAEEYAERRLLARLVEGSNPELVIQLGDAPAVKGHVVSAADGKPIAGATIHAIPNPGMEVRDAEPPSAVTDAAGAFRLRAGFTGQALTLLVRAKGFVLGRRYLSLPMHDDETVPLEVALDPTGFLSGVVRDAAGRPCPEATVFAYPAGTEARPMDRGIRGASAGNPGLVSTDVDRKGTYALEGLAIGGLYIVGASAPSSARSEEAEVYLTAGEPSARADFELRAPAGVFVKWPVGTGRNAGLGSATLRDLSSRSVAYATSGLGSCRFSDVAPGRYEVAVLALNAGRRGSAAIEVKAGETAIVEIDLSESLDGGDFQESTLEGWVTDGAGIPVPGVRVSAIGSMAGVARPLSTPRAMGVQVPGRGSFVAMSTAGTKEDGRFRIEGLREGADYRLLATVRGRISFADTAYRAPDSAIVIRLASMGRLKGRLVHPGGEGALSAMDIRVGGPGSESAFRTVASIPIDTGLFDTGDLLPGPCRIAAVVGEFLLPPRDAEVRAGEVVDLGDLPLVRGTVLAGRIVDSTGAPVPRVLVVLQGPAESRATTGEDGKFAVGPVAEEEPTLSLSAEGESRLVRTVSAANGGALGDLVLPRNGTLAIRTTRADGRPWAGEVEIRGSEAEARLRVIGHIDHLGRLSFSLAAGEYRIVIRDPVDREHVLAEAPAIVVGGMETKVELRVGR